MIESSTLETVGTSLDHGGTEGERRGTEDYANRTLADWLVPMLF